MIYGRLILIATTYYNKILDHEDCAYFVSINTKKPKFIKVLIGNLDRKSFIYTSSVIDQMEYSLEKLGMPIEEILRYSPFVKGSESKRKNYYRQKHPIKKTEMIVKPITLKFE